MRIFVSVAAYRDPELGPTLQDCIAKASYPQDLRFGVCWQHGDEEQRPSLLDDSRVRVRDVPWAESRGACWARSEVMGLFEGEDFYLQLDSHHRFVEGWDQRLLAMAEQTGAARPVLGTYAPAFTPGKPLPETSPPNFMRFDRFTPEGIILFRPAVVPHWERLTKPLAARFVSGHFLFAPGSFVQDVPYDPELYFTGEEITLAIRAFSLGYDLFHPHQTVLWHEYSRAYRPHKHWSDHDGKQTEQAWHARDVASKEKVRAFLANPHVGRLGLGTRRTMQDYEAFAGVSFGHLKAQEYTQRAFEPPTPAALPGWEEEPAEFQVDAFVERSALGAKPEAAQFWFMGFHDAAGNELLRQDIYPPEMASLLAQPGAELKISRSITSTVTPATWSVWPHHADTGWGTKLTGFPVPGPAGHPCTFVTSLVDIGRDGLAPAFQRDFSSHYLHNFKRLLKIPAPMVIFVDPAHEHVVWEHRSRELTKVVLVEPWSLEGFPWFDAVQDIRTRPEWRAQAAWLAQSPQAELPLYNPLVMSKPLWLDAVARSNPWNSDVLYWLDGGLTHTVDDRLLTAPSLGARLAFETGDFTCVAFPYPDGAEIHGFPRARLKELAGCQRVERVVRGGVFGGRPQAIQDVARRYRSALEETLSQGLMGTEESVLTLLWHRTPALFRCFEVEGNGLVAPFFRAVLEDRLDPLRVRADGTSPASTSHPGKAAAAPARTTPVDQRAAVYVQTFNAPAQAARWFAAARAGMPEVFEQPVKVLLDNSTQADTAPAYDALAKEHGFTVVRQGNLGITGGRLWTAQHFEEHTSLGAMVHFEDDMLPNAGTGLCRNGFPMVVPNLWLRALAVLEQETGLDFLKLSFSEFHGDHRENWAWFNLPEREREKYFPDGRALHVDAIKTLHGLPYLVGEAFYCNWPLFITRRGNQTLLLGDRSVRHEGGLMARWLRLAREGLVRSGVLLASPILHDRDQHYAAEERKEG